MMQDKVISEFYNKAPVGMHGLSETMGCHQRLVNNLFHYLFSFLFGAT